MRIGVLLAPGGRGRHWAFMTTAPDTITSPTGADLAVRWRDVERPRAVLAIQHGMAEHSGRYGRFQVALAEAGYASVAHDHRGHGLTAGRGPLGTFGPEGWDGVMADAATVTDAARARHPGAPLVPFGHSMGGVVAFDLVLAHPQRFAAAAVWNIAFTSGIEAAALRAALKVERFRRGSDVPSAIARKLTFETWNRRFAPNRTEFDWLSRDRAEVDAYVADPHAGHGVTVGMWQGVLKGMQRASDGAALASLPGDMPFHLLGGTDDPVTDGGKGVRRIAERLRAAGLTDVTCEVLPSTRHEALNEVNRDTTTRAFIGWLDERFAASGAGDA